MGALAVFAGVGGASGRKVRAAEAIFNHAANAIEIEDIETRVSEFGTHGRSVNPALSGPETAIRLSRNLTRRLEDLESRFQLVFEPRPINIQFVNNDFEVIHQILITLYTPIANDAGKGARP